MAHKRESHGSGIATERKSGSRKAKSGTEHRHPIGSKPIARTDRFVSQQFGADADQDGPSRQTSTAQDELGQM